MRLRLLLALAPAVLLVLVPTPAAAPAPLSDTGAGHARDGYPRVAGSHPATSEPAPAPDSVPECLPGEEWNHEDGCVAVQLPEETNGRAYG